MSLELLIGPMFAGKSSAIQSIVRRHEVLGWKIFVITHSIDTRYTDEPAIVNHDKMAIPAVSSEKLMPLLGTEEYANSRLVIVEEAQFFPDLVPFIRNVVDTDGKHAVVVGLDGDAERRPFGRVLDLVPLCDRVTKLTAFCKQCSDGTPALFTYDQEDQTEHRVVTQVGGGERYSALCRKHYLAGKQGLC
jgi:thymidine kinase